MRDAAELDRDVHVPPQIAPEIDHAHAAAPELADEVITVPDELPGSTLDHRATVTYRRAVDAIEHLIDRHGPSEICRVLAPMLSADRIARIDRVLASRLASLVTVVEDTYDPHNAAATIR